MPPAAASNDLVHPHWSDDNEAEPARDERAAMRAALRDRTLVIMGDSNVRYQYLSLVSFLGSGIWPATPKKRRAFSLCSENSVPGPSKAALDTDSGKDTSVLSHNDMHMLQTAWKWRAFFVESTRTINECDGGVGKGDSVQETCDCKYATNGLIENRFFSVGSGRHGRGPRVRVAYLGLRGFEHSTTLNASAWSTPMDESSFERLQAAAANSGQCAYGADSRSGKLAATRWPYVEELTFVEERLRGLRPDILVWAPGPWLTSEYHNAATAEATLRRLRAVTKRAIFRTCPRGSLRLGGRRGGVCNYR